jgi:hypothetical protein
MVWMYILNNVQIVQSVTQTSCREQILSMDSDVWNYSITPVAKQVHSKYMKFRCQTWIKVCSITDSQTLTRFKDLRTDSFVLEIFTLVFCI